MDKDLQVRDRGSNGCNDAPMSGHALDAHLENWDPSFFSLAHQDLVQLQQPDVVLGDDGMPIQAISPLDADQPERHGHAAAEEEHPYEPPAFDITGIVAQDQQPNFNNLNENGSLCQSVPAFDLNGTQTHLPDNQFPTFDNAQEQSGKQFLGLACQNGGGAYRLLSVSETISTSPITFPPPPLSSSTPIHRAIADSAITPSSDLTLSPSIPSSSNSPSSSGELSAHSLGKCELSPLVHATSTRVTLGNSTIDRRTWLALQYRTSTSLIIHHFWPTKTKVLTFHDLNTLQSVQPESIWSNDPLDPSYPFASLASYPHNGVTIARDTSITSPQLSDVVPGRPISDSELANGNAVGADSGVQRSFERGRLLVPWEEGSPGHAHEDESGATKQDDDAEGSNTSKARGSTHSCAITLARGPQHILAVTVVRPLGSFMQDAPVSRRKANPLQAKGPSWLGRAGCALWSPRGIRLCDNELRAQAGLFASCTLAHNRINNSLSASSLLPSSSGSTGVTRGPSESTWTKHLSYRRLYLHLKSAVRMSVPRISLLQMLWCLLCTGRKHFTHWFRRHPCPIEQELEGLRQETQTAALQSLGRRVKVDGAPLVERIRKHPIKKLDLPLYRGYPFYPDAPIPHRMITVKRSDVKRASTTPTSGHWSKGPLKLIPLEIPLSIIERSSRLTLCFSHCPTGPTGRH
ncbi:hypothetical protein BC629DRAFT_1444142 [Irpex lacteus]|nr:hypothetical protein BC629DRAFT_1444142 [Irpex lacteus]